jgi:hypothetical protein
MKTRAKRIAQIHQLIQSKGYTLDYNEQHGATLYKAGKFVHAPELQDLLTEYEQLRFLQDDITDDWDGTTKDGIYFLVADTVSGDNSNLFKDYQQALEFFNDDEAGADGDYDVVLSVVYFQGNEIIEELAIAHKSVHKQTGLSGISIYHNRVAVHFNGKTIVFVVWDLEPEQHADLKAQIETAFGICPDLDSIEKHLQINGYDAILEDVVNA